LKREKTIRDPYSIPCDAGFTIIEVLIVLAIATLILLVIMFAIPALNRNERNYERKHYVDVAAAAMLEYKANHGTLPDTPAKGADLINNYLNGVPSTVSFQFFDNSGSHGYLPPVDRVAIEFGHWCNRYGNGDAPTDFIAGAGNSDMNLNYYAIWTRLEPDSNPSATDGASLPNQMYYCIDDR
jgi:prepilin-type N-terminal cleavage/methylation domain-containing protein